jgi:hypothetical protein
MAMAIDWFVPGGRAKPLGNQVGLSRFLFSFQIHETVKEMQTAVILVFLFIFITHSLYAQSDNSHDIIPTSNPLATALDKKVDVEARQYMTRIGAVGMSIGVLKDGKTKFYGYGETERGNR